MQRLWMALLAASLFATGCGGSSDDDEDDDGSSSEGSTSGGSGSPTSGGSTGSGTEEYSCCLNGSFFDCPSEDALLQCGNDFDPSECNRVESRDDECAF